MCGEGDLFLLGVFSLGIQFLGFSHDPESQMRAICLRSADESVRIASIKNAATIHEHTLYVYIYDIIIIIHRFNC